VYGDFSAILYIDILLISSVSDTHQALVLRPNSIPEKVGANKNAQIKINIPARKVGMGRRLRNCAQPGKGRSTVNEMA
jgi:hypothetical protein